MRKKLFLTTLSIILFTLILSIVSVNFVFKQQFANYITQSNETIINQLPSRISAIYLRNDSWDIAALKQLNNDLPVDVYITLTDLQGNVIMNLENPMNAMHGGMMNMMGLDYSVKEWKTKELPIVGADQTIATAQIRYPEVARILNPQDEKFSAAIFHSLIFAGVLALMIGMLMSYWMSRRLVAPLQSLTEAANRIGSGQFDERVPVNSKDEIGRLANAFNGMADRLKHQEYLRKQFSIDIAHELRTPLTSIRSFIEAFEDGVLPPSPDNLAIINSEISRMVGLASDLKDLNTAEIGEIRISPQPINIVSLVDNVIRSLYALFQDKDLKVDFIHKVQDIAISGDERLLTRLFYNLIHNAYKYTETGGEIRIEVDDLLDEVQIRIKDTGIGIPESDLANIFERFYRTDRSRARETGGSGIGLALVKQIVLLHHGTISVESTVGKGSLFTVRLPKTKTKD